MAGCDREPAPRFQLGCEKLSGFSPRWQGSSPKYVVSSPQYVDSSFLGLRSFAVGGKFANLSKFLPESSRRLSGPRLRFACAACASEGGSGLTDNASHGQKIHQTKRKASMSDKRPDVGTTLLSAAWSGMGTAHRGSASSLLGGRAAAMIAMVLAGFPPTCRGCKQ